MSPRKLLVAAMLLASAASSANAQQPRPPSAEKPSINPDKDAEAGGKKNSGPFGSMGKDRPKDAKTEITAVNEATFDNNANKAVFEGKVFVKDPQFRLYCDKLIITLTKEHKGLGLAEAEGNVVIIQDNVNDKGEPVKSTGRAKHAEYNPATGNVTLTVWPQIQQGVNNHVAAEEGTVMILNREGRLETRGPSKTTLVDTGDMTP